MAMDLRAGHLRGQIEGAVLRGVLNLPPKLQRRLAGKPVRIDGNTLAPELQLMLRLQEIAREPHIEDLPLPEARKALVKQGGLAGGSPPVGAVRDLTVDGAGGPLPARLYTPTSRLHGPPAPTLMFFHGGGFIYGDLESHDGACRFLAERSGVQVLAVDYRLAPEHPFPAPLEDCIAAFRWLVDHADAVHADAERLAVGGDSAGGNLAARVAITAAEQGLPLRFQLLIYPVTKFGVETPSRKKFEEGFFLTAKFMDNATEGYLAGQDLSDPRASVGLSPTLPAGLAPAFVATAGFDPLRDEGVAYAELLAEHGVKVEAKGYGSMIHGFFNIVGCGHEAPANNADIAARLRAGLA